MITVIGMSDAAHPEFGQEALAAIGDSRLFAGGRRHHEIVAPLLPADHEWVDITVPVGAFVERLRQKVGQQEGDDRQAVVFASGDPLFYGIASTLQRLWPEAQLRVLPCFHSLQTLAHRLTLPYHDMRVVTLTGRPWHEFDRALIEGAAMIGVLTDAVHTPSAIAHRMLTYGYTDYRMHVGVALGNADSEQVASLSLHDVAQQTFARPCCAIIVGHHDRQMYLADAAFEHLEGRSGMMTKMPFRQLTLAALELHRRRVLWDVGACTGSITIEARLQHPHLHVVCFERRPECESIIQTNSHRFGVPIDATYIGNFIDILHEGRVAVEPRPDAIFVGGHGGRLHEILSLSRERMAADGCIVMNSVSQASQEMWHKACSDLHLTEAPPMYVCIDNYNPITILKATLCNQ